MVDMPTKVKPLTKTEVYNKLINGDKFFRRVDFFNWVREITQEEFNKGFIKGNKFELSEEDFRYLCFIKNGLRN